MLTKIGFIGVGIMGKPMAKNLIRAGYDLLVHDTNRNAVEEVVRFGARAANSPREIAERSELIITMLPNSPQVEEVALGKDGLVEAVTKDQVYIDMSSIEPLIAGKVAKKMGEKGVECLDAPVSGGEPKAIDGTLAIMVGGSRDTFEKCREILEKMGKNVVRVGETGSGQTTKLVNQIIVAVNIAAMSEAFVLGKKAGVNPKNIYEAIRGGLAGSNVLDAKAPLIINRNFKPGFKIDLHIKDMANVFKTSHQLNVPLPLTSIVMEIMQALRVENLGDADHSAIALFYENIAKTKIEE